MKEPIVYLKKELGFQLSEWGKLDDNTKEWYRNAATEEMKIRDANGETY